MKDKPQILLVKLTTAVFFQNERFVKSILPIHASAPELPSLTSLALQCRRVGDTRQYLPGQRGALGLPFLKLLELSFSLDPGDLSCSRCLDGFGFG